MEKEALRIVFMGTPEFAVPSLAAIVEGGYQVAGVITAPDRRSGRGRKMQPSPVKQYAQEIGLEVLQPEKLKEPLFLNQFKALRPDLAVVVAFRMLPQAVWSVPQKGTFNLHASLLPQYRGAAPINHAIINGEKESGLTTFFIDDKIDTGQVIDQVRMPIGDNESFGEVHDRMMVKGAGLTVETIEMIRKDRVILRNQSNMMAESIALKTAPKLTKEFCQVNWQKSLDEIHNFIRGLSPYPGAYTYLFDGTSKPQYLKILKASKEVTTHSYKEGTLVSDGRSYLKVAVKGGYVHLSILQLSGKRSMEIVDFLNGFSAREGMYLGFNKG
jgi:methionyl-tRNA formyltransferase